MAEVLSVTKTNEVSNTIIGKPSMMEHEFFGGMHPLFRLFGIKIDHINGTVSSMKMPFSIALSDLRGGLHCGAVATLLDTNCGLAVFGARRSMSPIATLDLRVDFVSGIPPGSGLKSEVECIGFDDDVAFVAGRAFCDDNKVVAIVNGSFAVNTLGPEMRLPKEKSRNEIENIKLVTKKHDADLLNIDAFSDFLGISEYEHQGTVRYSMFFREAHLGNPLIRTFHGGVLAGFGEVVAAHYFAKLNGWSHMPVCQSLTIDYMRPAFEGEVIAEPKIIFRGRRFLSVSVNVTQNGKTSCIGRFIFKNCI